MFIYFDCNPTNVELIFSKIDEILLKIKKGDFVTFLINTQKEDEADVWLKSHGFNPGNVSGPGLALYSQLHSWLIELEIRLMGDWI